MTDTYDLDSLKSIDELHEMPVEEAKEYFLKMKELHGAEKIRLKWNISIAAMYKKFYTDYDIKSERKQQANKENNIVVETQKPERKIKKQKNKKDANEKIDDIISNVPQFNVLPTYMIQVRGEFQGVDARDRLIKIAEALTEEKYKVTLTIEEL